MSVRIPAPPHWKKRQTEIIIGRRLVFPSFPLQNYVIRSSRDEAARGQPAYLVGFSHDLVLHVRPVELDEMQRPILSAGGHQSAVLVVHGGSASQLKLSPTSA